MLRCTQTLICIATSYSREWVVCSRTRKDMFARVNFYNFARVKYGGTKYLRALFCTYRMRVLCVILKRLAFHTIHLSYICMLIQQAN